MLQYRFSFFYFNTFLLLIISWFLDSVYLLTNLKTIILDYFLRNNNLCFSAKFSVVSKHMLKHHGKKVNKMSGKGVWGMLFLALLTWNIYQPLPNRLFEKESHYWELVLVAPDELDLTHQFGQYFLTEIASLAYQACKVPGEGIFYASVVQKKRN